MRICAGSFVNVFPYRHCRSNDSITIYPALFCACHMPVPRISLAYDLYMFNHLRQDVLVRFVHILLNCCASRSDHSPGKRLMVLKQFDKMKTKRLLLFFSNYNSWSNKYHTTA